MGASGKSRRSSIKGLRVLFTTVDRKVALLKANLTAAEIAREVGASEALVSLVISGRITSGPKAVAVKERIAAATGLPLDVLFPMAAPGSYGRRSSDRAS
jgi:transcriptional regulator with XRE-family HTH domain